MEITGKMLLNSAETILRERREDTGSSSRQGIDVAAKNRPSQSVDSLSQGTLQSRLLNLQASLSELQKSYSREQSRLAYLNGEPDRINENLVFDNQTLFGELKEGKSIDEMRSTTEHALEGIIRLLKRTEVEMENMFALHFDNAESLLMEKGSRVDPIALKNIDPERVAKLTR